MEYNTNYTIKMRSGLMPKNYGRSNRYEPFEYYITPPIFNSGGAIQYSTGGGI